MRLLLIATCCWFLAASAPALGQEEELPADVVQAVRAGRAADLEARFIGTQKPLELHLLAQAHSNQARRARDDHQRARAFEKAGERYRQWIEALEQAARHDSSAQARVELAVARLEYANMLMGLRAAGELDRYEITDGRQGDRASLKEWLTAAREQYRQAAALITPLYDQLYDREDELLAAGVYDAIIRLKLDITFNDGWANYYLALVAPRDDEARGAVLRAAERSFQELLDSGQAGQMLAQCHLGLAVVQRELKRYDDAERGFAQALQEDPSPPVAAQARYELARCHVRTGKFAEARTVLRPLLEQDLTDLPPEEHLLRFYVNLARLWEANSYLLESDAIGAQVAGSTAKTAIRRRAHRARETGLAKLNRLAAQGGPWPAIVQLYVASGLDPQDDLTQLSPIELLYTARQLCEAQRYQDARRRLQAALTRPEFAKEPAQRSSDESDVGAQILMELGKCYYRLHQPRSAAEAFEQLAREYRSHALAPQAATFAYQLWAQVAQESAQHDDYQHLADTLLNLIQSFPDHPDRAEAAWLLAVAWQAAGRYAEASAEFAKTPTGSPHWEEAQFRRWACARLALEAARATQTPEQYRTQACEVAAELTRYADGARKRAGELTRGKADAIRKYAAQAQLNAAEALAGPGVEQYDAALAAVADFEQQYADSELIGRVLGLRIRAERGLRRFEQATAVLERYLQTVPAEQAGAVLAALARGMQEEVERLQAMGQAVAARRLAAESIDTFVRLEQWLRQQPDRAASVPIVTFGRAQMLYVAGEFEPARQLVAKLLEQDAQNGNYRRLMAQILTAQLPAGASGEQLQAAQAAWGELLKDPTLRKRAPERFWEARYNWLALLLRAGNVAAVEQAIGQELVWEPDLGGPPWRDKLLELRRQARTHLGLPAEDTPATHPAPAPQP